MSMSRQPRAPLLRMPPFPGARPFAPFSVAHAAVGARRVDMAEATALFEAIATARVGGAFWDSPARQLDPLQHILIPADRNEIGAMQAALGANEHGGVALLGTLAPAGVKHLSKVDPWSLLDCSAVLHVSTHHEIATLALITGRPIRLYGDDAALWQDTAAARPLIAGQLLANTAYHDPFTGISITALEAVTLLGEWRRLLDANRPIGAAAGVAWWKRRSIERLLWAPRQTPLRFARFAKVGNSGAGVAIWPSRVSPKAVRSLRQAGLSIAQMEDGFIRSSGLGSGLHRPYSIAVDWQGLHFDPSRPSDLEDLLQTTRFEPALLARAARLRERLVGSGVAKYGVSEAADLPHKGGGRLVLVTGQVGDDWSVRLGGAGVDNLCLLQRARQLEPDAQIWYRPHPDVVAGHRRGAIADRDALHHADHVVRVGGMAQLLGIADAVHVVTSLSGFEALLRGKEVTVHGVPFYAGWGLTRDLAAVPARRSRRLTVDELVAAALILYPQYLDPATELPCSAETLVSRLAKPATVRASPLHRLRAAQGAIIRMLRR